jgi:hypothetical protein
MIARTNPQAFYGLPPTTLRPTHPEISLPKISGRISRSNFTPYSQQSHLNHIENVGFDDLCGTSSSGEAGMDIDSPSQRSLLSGDELFGLRSTANPISSLSKEQELRAAKWEIETLRERLTSIEQPLLESRSKVEAQH